MPVHPLDRLEAARKNERYSTNGASTASSGRRTTQPATLIAGPTMPFVGDSVTPGARDADLTARPAVVRTVPIALYPPRKLLDRDPPRPRTGEDRPVQAHVTLR